jgi:hypothetical protein
MSSVHGCVIDFSHMPLTLRSRISIKESMKSDVGRPQQPDAGLAAETRPIPSQAEGEDEEVETKDTTPGAGLRPCPSQAEGDLETIEADLSRTAA